MDFCGFLGGSHRHSPKARVWRKLFRRAREPAVCEGMENTLERFPQTVVCLEYSPDALQELGFEPRNLLDFFRTRGYQLYVLTREEPRLVAEDNSLEASLNEQGYLDLLCSKHRLA